MTSIDRKHRDAAFAAYPNGINLSALDARTRRGLSRQLQQPDIFTDYPLRRRVNHPDGSHEYIGTPVPVDLCKLIRYIAAGYGNKHAASADVQPVSE